jgi:hypothetical protein
MLKVFLYVELKVSVFYWPMSKEGRSLLERYSVGDACSVCIAKIPRRHLF